MRQLHRCGIVGAAFFWVFLVWSCGGKNRDSRTDKYRSITESSHFHGNGGSPNAWSHSDGNISHSRFVREEIKPPLRVIWDTACSGDVSPAVGTGDGIILTGTSGIYCYRIADGSPTWLYRGMNWDAVRYPRNPVSTSSDDLVFWDSNAKSLVILRAADGKVARTVPTSTVATRLGPSPIEFERGKILISEESKSAAFRPYDPSTLLSVNIATGVIDQRKVMNFGLWTSGASFEGFRPDYCGTIDRKGIRYFLVDDRTLIITSDSPFGQLSGIRWVGELSCGPVASNDHLYLFKYPEVTCLDNRSNVVWNVRLQPVRMSPTLGGPPLWPAMAASDDCLVVSGSDALRVLSTRNGHVLWSCRLAALFEDAWEMRYVWHNGPVITGRVLYFIADGGRKNKVYKLMACDLTTGKPLWSKEFNHQVTGLLAHLGSLYVSYSASNASSRLLRLSPSSNR